VLAHITLIGLFYMFMYANEHSDQGQHSVCVFAHRLVTLELLFIEVLELCFYR